MLLTLIINSLNSTILLTAIQNQDLFLNPQEGSVYTTTPPCTRGCVSTYFNRNFGFRKESQTFKRMALIVILSIRQGKSVL